MFYSYKKRYFYICVILFFSNFINSNGFNAIGQTGLITIPSASTQQEQSIFFTYNKSEYTKFGALTVTPFKWLEASFFYSRPDDLLWGNQKGLYLDKGFNVKFSYYPDNRYLPNIAIGLDDFAGTGQLSKEYIVSTYRFNSINVTTGLGWGKFVGDTNLKYKNPISFLKDSFEFRTMSSNYNLGGSPSYDTWFRGDVTIFGGLEYYFQKNKNISLKIENNPFDYFDYMCCGEGLSPESSELRKKDSSINFGLSYKIKNFGYIDLSYIKGNTWNMSFSIGFSSKTNLQKKNKFEPKLVNTNYNQSQKNEFYLDLLENLNRNKLYLQTADIDESKLKITIDSEVHSIPIRYTKEAVSVANNVSKMNGYEFDSISVSHISRGIQLNEIKYLTENINNKYKPTSLIKRETKLNNPDNEYKKHAFTPSPVFPLILNEFSPDFRTHVGSPEKVMFYGVGIKAKTEIQLNRNLVIHSTINQPIEDNFDRKKSRPTSQLQHVRTDIVDYLQNTSNDPFISNLHLENIWSPLNDIYARFSFGLLEPMFGGVSTEIMFKPFNSRFSISGEYNSVRQRDYNQKFDFQEYSTETSHINIAFYEPKSNILFNYSYGKYLAGDKGYTLDISRRMPSGWRAGIFFTRTNVSAELFGEGSFDKGFYLSIPHNIFSKGYSKSSTGFTFRPMTRDGGQKLEIQNRLINSFYGSNKIEINEGWNE